MFVVVSTSRHSSSRSRLLARHVTGLLEDNQTEIKQVDLSELSLPRCDGESAYSDPSVIELNQVIREAEGIVLATPIYNYSICSEAKNLIELTGQSWKNRFAGFLCAAGGQRSYMSIMNIANSLMLDFRTFILPRFVYATGDAFSGNQVSDPDLLERLERFAEEFRQTSAALASIGSTAGDDK